MQQSGVGNKKAEFVVNQAVVYCVVSQCQKQLSTMTNRSVVLVGLKRHLCLVKSDSSCQHDCVCPCKKMQVFYTIMPVFF